MRKKLFIATSFVLFIGLIGLLVLRFLSLTSSQSLSFLDSIVGKFAQRGSAEGTVEGTTFELVNKIPAYQISDSKVDQKQLLSYLQDMGLNPIRDKEFIEYSISAENTLLSKVRKADYKTIRVTFLPATDLPEGYANALKFKSYHLIDESLSDRLVNAYFAGTTHEDVFDIVVYIDPVAAQQFGFTPAEYLTQSYLKSLFFNFYDQDLKSFSNPAEEFANRIKNTSVPIIKVDSKTSLLNPLFLEALKQKLIPQAFAACGGARCGSTTTTIGTCSGLQTTTYSCSKDGSACPCGEYSGTCESHTTTTGGGQKCSGSCPSGAGTCQGYKAPVCKPNGPDEACVQSGASCYIGGCECGIGSCGAPTCVWGAWTPCSATCGPGTRSRKSSCGVTQTESCNNTACCGNGSCSGGETCNSCSSDCGVCAPPPGPYCGDNVCNNGESCGSCAKDCGTCPTSPPSCTPSCTLKCGQNDGCNGSCSNSDSGSPGVVTDLNPADGFTATSSNGSITLTWSAASKADVYEIQVYPVGTPVGQECSVANSHCPSVSSARTFTFPIDPGVTKYNWRVRGINTTCGTNPGPWTVPITFTFGGDLTGGFNDDDGGIATINPVSGLCESVANTPIVPPAGSRVTAVWNGNTSQALANNAYYQIQNIGYDTNTVVALTLPTGYRCTCPAGCTYSGITVPSDTVNFYITDSPVGWWQTANAYLYAGVNTGVAMRSQIPTTCTGPSCIAAVSTYDRTATPKSDSTSISGGGTVDSTADSSNEYSFLNQSKTNTHAEGIRQNGPKENYTYFSQAYGITSSSPSDFTGNQPVTGPANGEAYYSGSSVVINNQWTLNTADSVVVFVNGNLTIKAPIRVAKGAFLAFIVNGNIIFDKTLGSNTSNNPSVAGVYIAEGQIISESNSPGTELKFVGEGTFVGWGGVQLLRNFNNGNTARGATEPIETFNFRPDFLLTVPTKMTKPIYLWQETN